MTQNYKTQRTTVADDNIPIISTGLDSVKSYQFEVYIDIPTAGPGAEAKELVLAAHKVTGLDMELDIIEVPRVNDKLYYPARAKMGTCTITFDDQFLTKNGAALWDYLTRMYNPLTGVAIVDAPAGAATGNTSFKLNSMKIIQLKNDMTPFSETTLYGVFPTSWKSGEFNYTQGTSFHTIDMSFKYDFMSHTAV
jgi:hypothetical protein